MFEKPKIVVQRIRGKGSVRAAIDHSGIYVGHTCTVVQPRESSIDLETVLKVVRSPLMDGLTRIERGIRMDLYPKDVAALPFPTSWLEDTDIPLDEAFALTRSQVARLEHFAG